jgi:recombinational DNA repair ATPase RecF
MRVRSLQLENFRSFEKTPEIQLDAITVLIGANNAGKSSILKSLYLMQAGGGSGFADVRAGAGVAKVSCLLRDISNESWGIAGKAQLTIKIESQDRKSGSTRFQLAPSPESYRAVSQLPSVEPHHFIIPYLSKRKTASYAEDVRRNHAMQVQPSMSNLGNV